MSDRKRNPRIPKPQGSMSRPKADELATRRKRDNTDAGPKKLNGPSPLNPEAGSRKVEKKPSPLADMYKERPHIPLPGEVPPKSYYKQIGPFKILEDKQGNRVKYADYLCTQCNKTVRTLRPCDVKSGRRKTCGCKRAEDQTRRMARFYDRIQKLQDDLAAARAMIAKYKDSKPPSPRHRKAK